MLFSPNRDVGEFEEYLEELETIIKQANSIIIICSDLNAKSVICGSTNTNKKGDRLEELILSNKLLCVNDGSNTFCNKNGSSLIDITLVSERHLSYISEWNVLDQMDSGSKHAYIVFQVKRPTTEQQRTPNTQRGWIITKTGIRKMINGLNHMKLPTEQITAHLLVKSIATCCDMYLKPKNHSKTKHKPVYWWTQEIAEQRKECHKERRTFTRAKATHSTAEKLDRIKTQLKKARHRLKTLIKREKEKHWNEPCADLEKDIWGRGYQIVTKKLRQTNTAPLSHETVQLQINKLFPSMKEQTWNPFVTERQIEGQMQKTR